MRLRFLAIAFLALIIAGAGCGTDDGTDQAAGNDTEGGLDGQWVLNGALIDETPLTPVDGHPITLELEGDRIGGNAGCNSFGGTYSVDGTALDLVDVSITEMACVDVEAMATESTFMDGLWRADTIERLDQELVIGGEGVSLTFTPAPEVPTAPVVETVWTLDTLLEGEAASSTINGADPATLRLAPDGTFTASTGCRAIDGTYSLAQDLLSLEFSADDSAVDDPAVDDPACEGPAEQQDPAVLAVLRQELTVDVVEDRLTLSAEDGTGLSYRSLESGSDGP